MKKIFFRGKVYDHKQKNLFDIQREIQQELDTEYGIGKLRMDISIPGNNQYQFILHRVFTNNVKPGMSAFDHQTVYMFDFDMFLGNDPSSQGRPFSFMMNYYENVDTFEKLDKQKAVKEGGTAPVPSSEILYNQAIIDGIARSAEAGKEVEIVIPEI